MKRAGLVQGAQGQPGLQRYKQTRHQTRAQVDALRSWAPRARPPTVPAGAAAAGSVRWGPPGCAPQGCQGRGQERGAAEQHGPPRGPSQGASAQVQPEVGGGGRPVCRLSFPFGRAARCSWAHFPSGVSGEGGGTGSDRGGQRSLRRRVWGALPPLMKTKLALPS